MKVTSYLIEAHIFRQTKNDIEFLLLKRAQNEPYPEIWQMVTGTIHENEKAYETALREIKEETGFQPDQLWIVPNMNSFYSPEENHVCMVPVFAALVSSENNVILSKEHSEYSWVKKDKAKKLLAWQGQRDSVDIIYEYFTNERSFFKFVEIKL